MKFANGVVALPDYGCVVWVDDETLYSMEARTFRRCGHIVNYDDAVEITAPHSQEFLDDVNGNLGTSFQFDEFAGR